MFPVVILSGGLAKRLHPITKNIPKSLIPIAGKAFVIHQLEYLRKQGIKKVVFCLNHLGEMIENKIGNGKNFSMEITYSYDGLVPLGTGGSIVKALPLLESNFFILYGDSYLPLNFKKVEIVYKSTKKKALMTVFKNNNEFDKSNVMFLNQKLIRYNKENPLKKMNYIDYGLSIVSASIFKKYANYLTFDLAEVYKDLSLKKKLAGLEVHERFYEIGSHIGLKETESYLLSNKKI
jgi:N-acetyl-alpha-D-muramate 1-phosphate uridylyltransferase